MKVSCSCGKSYWPAQKWQHESCSAPVVEAAPKAPQAKARSSIPVQASSFKQGDSIKHRMSVLGKVGGPRGGAARAARLSPERRAEIARAAALARWGRS